MSRLLKCIAMVLIKSGREVFDAAAGTVARIAATLSLW